MLMGLLQMVLALIIIVSVLLGVMVLTVVLYRIGLDNLIEKAEDERARK